MPATAPNRLMPMPFPGARAAMRLHLRPRPLSPPIQNNSAPRQRPRLRSALGSSCWRPSARAAIGSCLAARAPTRWSN